MISQHFINITDQDFLDLIQTLEIKSNLIKNWSKETKIILKFINLVKRIEMNPRGNTRVNLIEVADLQKSLLNESNSG